MARPSIVLALFLLPTLYGTRAATAQAPGSTAWVGNQVKELTSSDVRASKAARDALAREADRSGSPATFPKDLNKALIPLAKSRNVRDRIAAGVVAEQVAAKTSSSALEGVARALMENDTAATALLGVKVAKALLPTVVTLPKDQTAAAVVACVKSHPDSGEIAEEAYAALTLQAGRKSESGPPAAAIVAAVPELLNLLEIRICGYGEHTPPKPGADGKAAAFLALEAWPAVSTSAPTANRILRDLGDLVCVQVRAVGDGNTDRDLNASRRQATQSLQVVGGASLKTATDDLMKPLEGVDPGEIDRRCSALDSAMPPAAKLARAKR